VGPASIAESIREVLVEWGILTRWLRSRLACDEPGGHRVRVGDGSRLEVGVLVVERNFAEFSSEGARDHFRKCHESDLRFGNHGEASLEGASTVRGTNPGAEDECVAVVEGSGWFEKD
jgi:hypothetical protein